MCGSFLERRWTALGRREPASHRSRAAAMRWTRDVHGRADCLGLIAAACNVPANSRAQPVWRALHNGQVLVPTGACFLEPNR